MQATLSAPVSRPVVRVDRAEHLRPRIQTPVAPRPVSEPALRPEVGNSLQRWLDLCG